MNKSKSLLERLQEKGVKVYSGSSLWVPGEIISKITIGANAVVTKSERYHQFQLVIEANGQRVYIPLKSGASPSAEEFTIQEFTATRDWEEYKITAGETRVFAI